MQTATRTPAPKTSNRSSAPQPHRPLHEIRMGRVSAAIWENETSNGSMHNVTVSRLYKDGDQWKRSTSFGRDDLPLVIKVLDAAHTWIFEHGHASRESDETEQS